MSTLHKCKLSELHVYLFCNISNLTNTAALCGFVCLKANINWLGLSNFMCGLAGRILHHQKTESKYKLILWGEAYRVTSHLEKK